MSIIDALKEEVSSTFEYKAGYNVCKEEMTDKFESLLDTIVEECNAKASYYEVRRTGDSGYTLDTNEIEYIVDKVRKMIKEKKSECRCK